MRVLDFFELLNECVETLLAHKLRSLLAVLGIVIGIGSVIALVALGQSSQRSVEQQIQSLGANLLTVISGGQNTGGVRGAAGGATTLTLADARAITAASELTTIQRVSPELSRRVQVVAGRNNANTQVMGAEPEYAEIRKVSIDQGNFITQSDVDGLAKVAVLGPQLAANLFPDGQEPVGQLVRISGQVFRVIGLTTAKGGTGFNNPDDMLYVPLSTAQKQLFGVEYVSSIVVEAKSQEMMSDAQNEIGYFLLKRHQLTDPSAADFVIFSQNDILSTASQVTGTFTTFLGGIAAISLLVGGIGIMNIMLVTVTERTREIGLRKALGARKAVIVLQFLLEAVLLTITGGVVGIAVGILGSLGLATLLRTPFVVDGSSVFVAVGVSGLIGVSFGWYPAKKAADLQPIEALRYE
jgi:putative ABC transport system permease protein